MAKNYVYSTLTADNTYVHYEKGINDMPLEKKRVVIKGGSNVVDRKHIITPRGIVTEVSDEELELLKANETFQRHVTGGFISYDAKKVDPEVRAADMEGRDESSPLTPNDYANFKGAKPRGLDVHESAGTGRVESLLNKLIKGGQ